MPREMAIHTMYCEHGHLLLETLQPEAQIPSYILEFQILRCSREHSIVGKGGASLYSQADSTFVRLVYPPNENSSLFRKGVRTPQTNSGRSLKVRFIGLGVLAWLQMGPPPKQTIWGRATSHKSAPQANCRVLSNCAQASKSRTPTSIGIRH